MIFAESNAALGEQLLVGGDLGMLDRPHPRELFERRLRGTVSTPAFVRLNRRVGREIDEPASVRGEVGEARLHLSDDALDELPDDKVARTAGGKRSSGPSDEAVLISSLQRPPRAGESGR